MTVNKVILVGRLGKDPEVRQTNNGTPVATLRLATSERRKGADGNWGEHTEWHSVTAWGKTAEFLQKYITKGRMLYVEGRLQTREWTDKDNNKRYSTEVVADTVHALGGRGDEAGGGEGGGGYNRGGGGGGGPTGGGRSGGGTGGRGGGGGGGGGRAPDYGDDYGGGGGGGGGMPFEDDVPF